MSASALREIERGLASVVRYGNLPRIREHLARHAGVRVEAAGYGVLSRLGDDGPRRPTDLAGVLGVDVSTLSRQVKPLEIQGLVERSSDPNDGRAAVLRLTAPGRQAVEKLRSARHAALRELLVDWSVDDRRVFGSLLSRFADHLIDLSAL